MFVCWLRSVGISVVVWDMDQTMTGGHCGQGQPRTKLDEYIDATSADFVSVATVLAARGEVRQGVATSSDPKEYKCAGQSRKTHLCGADLATELLQHKAPAALPAFQALVGYDYRLHGRIATHKGKRFHMRQIAAQYKVPFEQLLLIDDSPANLQNEDGWRGLAVQRPREGFRLDDLLHRPVFNTQLQQRSAGCTVALPISVEWACGVDGCNIIAALLCARCLLPNCGRCRRKHVCVASIDDKSSNTCMSATVCACALM